MLIGAGQHRHQLGCWPSRTWRRMLAVNFYYQNGMWTQGSIQQSVDVPLDPSSRYLVTGGMTQTDGAGLAHLYISVVCFISGDVQSCGVRDADGDSGLWLVEELDAGASK